MKKISFVFLKANATSCIYERALHLMTSTVWPFTMSCFIAQGFLWKQVFYFWYHCMAPGHQVATLKNTKLDALISMVRDFGTVTCETHYRCVNFFKSDLA